MRLIWACQDTSVCVFRLSYKSDKEQKQLNSNVEVALWFNDKSKMNTTQFEEKVKC